jgi:hypothetical protein
MEHTVYLDDTTADGKKMLKELRRCRKGVRFEKPEANSAAPDGYMTSEAFWKEADKRIIDVCKKYGIL